MSLKPAATLYYDIISPFAYIYIKQRQRLEHKLDITPVPILLGGLFRATENKGPGEIAAKRPHTYQFCVWQAEKLGIPFRFPEHHPFLTVVPQRLLLEQNADWAMVERAFDYVWLEGKDPNLSWSEFCTYLGLAAETPKPDTPEIKAALIANTNQAKMDGAFGVPALILNKHCFWGVDTIDWTLDYLARPGMFEEASYASAANMPNGLT
ncbi:2-hydroxychromene-2-carboxylate isomerase [Polynucleobacter alcilacus]|jgi:2-hydroxychromene-2-carboxylate isomerase|uniref:2-hydroxychromene-2-carboxylate isomerase n=1 Tax=Polynucleobacter alcilacus TaxID=1819739 RepID=UPI001C0B0380|nr:DsbA family protein [Polynucleobacter alcilacus]MBU3566999.1 DsbA family protein [Polynucleobacter alcilacus]